MFQLDEESFKSRARIKVIGVGGGGGNAIKTMRQSGLTGVQFMVANTDVQALEEHEGTDFVIQMGAQLTGGLGAGANPEIGRQAAIESCEQIGEALKGANMVFITAGMGGGTGTGSAGVIARLAKEQGALTVGVVTRPFFFEGQRRSRHAEMGIQFLKENVDTLIVIPNQKLLTAHEEEDSSLLSAFKSVDNILLTAVQGIVDLINQKGLINLDFADVKTIMSEKGLAIIGTGSAQGEGRALRAGQMAISSPLLEDSSFKGASGLIINIRGGADLSLKEVNQTAELISSSAHPDAEIIFGAIVNPDKSDRSLKVTVIATGFEGRQNEEKDREEPRTTSSHLEVKKEQSAPLNNLDIKSQSPQEEPSEDMEKIQSPAGVPVSEEEQSVTTQSITTQRELSKNLIPEVHKKEEGASLEEKSVKEKPSSQTKKLPRDILLEKAKAYQKEMHEKQMIEKDNQQISMNMGAGQNRSQPLAFQQAPFKKQKLSLMSFFRKSEKTLP